MEVEMLPKKPKSSEDNKTKLTHIKGMNGWKNYDKLAIHNLSRIVYLGNCDVDGDMFAIYYGINRRIISFCKGSLNNGNL